ncbi:MAG: glycosyltransferase [Candidatus Hydrogenedentes bacterium]|nr:glycosyltransferase [Candidatus Hydrogenedentota bacterium]
MRILIVNKYHKITGGADRYALGLAALLTAHGHEPAFVAMDQPDNLPAGYPLYTIPAGVTNATWRTASLAGKARAYAAGVYNRHAARVVAGAIAEFRPDVLHAQNLFYQLSPSVLRAAGAAGVPVVQTLHDYQPVCANNTLHCRGRICEDCKPRRFLNILKNRCYNDSLAASWLAFSAKVVHTAAHLYPAGIDAFIAPSRFLKEKIESFGLHMPPIQHVNNFLDTAGLDPDYAPGDYALFFGQLLKHKGIFTLLDAVAQAASGMAIAVAGTGPESDEVARRVERLGLSGVRLVGYQSGKALYDLIRRARFVVVPSEWYENQPYAVLESFALGKPVLASAIGGIPELVDDEVGGLFTPGDTAELAAKLAGLGSDTARLREMGMAARHRVAEAHSPEAHLERLLGVYAQVGAPE